MEQNIDFLTLLFVPGELFDFTFSDSGNLVQMITPGGESVRLVQDEKCLKSGQHYPCINSFINNKLSINSSLVTEDTVSFISKDVSSNVVGVKAGLMRLPQQQNRLQGQSSTSLRLRYSRDSSANLNRNAIFVSSLTTTKSNLSDV